MCAGADQADYNAKGLLLNIQILVFYTQSTLKSVYVSFMSIFLLYHVKKNQVMSTFMLPQLRVVNTQFASTFDVNILKAILNILQQSIQSD